MRLSFSRPADRSRHSTATIVKGLTWLFCVVLIAIGWFAIVQQIRFEREQAVEEAIAQNENRAIAFEQYVRRTLEVAAIATRYVAERFRRGDARAEFFGTPERPAVLRGNLARTGTFVGIAIVDANGDLVGTSRPDARPLNVAASEAFRVHVARDSGQLFVSRPIPAAVFGRDVILLTRRLSGPDGAFAGVVSLIITPEQFSAFYRDARVGPRHVVSVIGLDGIVRARRVGQVTSAGEDFSGQAFMRRQLANPVGTSLGVSASDGVERYFSQRRLRDYPLFVVYGVPADESLAAPNRRAGVLITAAALGTAAILGFATVLTLLVNRNERRGREIAEENERLEQAQRIGEIGDWRYGLQDDPLYWSPQIYRLYERDPARGPLPTAEFRNMLDDEGRAAVERAMGRVFGAGEPQQFEFKIRLPSGVDAWHRVVAMPVRDENGQIAGVQGTTQNVTGRKLIEQLETRVAQLSRIDAMNAMATTLAHELNQPLAAAVNYLSGCRRHLDAGPVDEPSLREGLRDAEQQIHFAGEIIRRVREMVANQPKALSSFSLSPVIDDALALIATAQDQPRPKVTKRLPADARRVRADRVQVQQILINLLRNALEATREVDHPDIVIASRRNEDGTILVCVSDNGPGFSQPAAERFSPFAAREGGMGLGLSISRTIVESHGGRIWTEDRPGGGAQVNFTLPAPRERPAGAREPAAGP